MSEKTKAQLQAELKAAKENISDLKCEVEKFRDAYNHILSVSSERGAEINNLKSINQNQTLKIQDLHDGIKLLQQKLESANGLAAIYNAEKAEMEKAKLREIDEHACTKLLMEDAREKVEMFDDMSVFEFIVYKMSRMFE